MELLKTQEVLLTSLRTRIAITVKDKGEKIDDAIFTTVGGIEIYLIGAIDKEKEAERIKKEIANLDKIIKTVEVKLNKKEFISKAPENVVKKEKDKLKKWKTELKSLKNN